MMDFESETRVGWYKNTTLKWLNSAFVGLFIQFDSRSCLFSKQPAASLAHYAYQTRRCYTKDSRWTFTFTHISRFQHLFYI
jgi:hypothetical protein